MELNKIYAENCLQTMGRMNDGFVDLTVTSPPYDSLRTYNGAPEDQWSEENWKQIIAEIFRVTKQGGVVVWVVNDSTVGGSETGTSFKQALWAKECGFNLHDTMIWEKHTFTDTGSLRVRYAGVFEYMFVWSKGKPKTFNPIKDRPAKGSFKKHGTVRQADGSVKSMSSLGKVYANEEAQRFNIWRMDTERSNKGKGHPARFPESLANDHIISWSNEGDLVYDPFMGSGTTAAMSIINNRKFIGSEISEEYVKIAEERFLSLQNDRPHRNRVPFWIN